MLIQVVCLSAVAPSSEHLLLLLLSLLLLLFACLFAFVFNAFMLIEVVCLSVLQRRLQNTYASTCSNVWWRAMQWRQTQTETAWRLSEQPLVHTSLPPPRFRIPIGSLPANSSKTCVRVIR